jgi:hypothetical protein
MMTKKSYTIERTRHIIRTELITVTANSEEEAKIAAREYDSTSEEEITEETYEVLGE